MFYNQFLSTDHCNVKILDLCAFSLRWTSIAHCRNSQYFHYPSLASSTLQKLQRHCWLCPIVPMYVGWTKGTKDWYSKIQSTPDLVNVNIVNSLDLVKLFSADRFWSVCLFFYNCRNSQHSHNPPLLLPLNKSCKGIADFAQSWTII